MSEILRKLEKSEFVYTLQYEKDIAPKEYHENLITNNFHLFDSAGIRSVREYTYSEQAETLFLQAEAYYQRKDFRMARRHYQAILAEDPDNYKIWTYIGQTYEVQGMWEEAKNYYETVVQNNPIDFLASWFLSGIYYEIGRDSEAIVEITRAHVLNRNNPRILQTLNQIYDVAAAEVEAWYFSPRIQLEKTDSMQVSVAFTEPWIGYALCKALWTYEPGFAESRGKMPGTVSPEEERDCLNSYLTTASRDKIMQRSKEYLLLNRALDNDLLEEFIYYELFLPSYPHLVRHLSEDDLRRLVYYVITVRGGITLTPGEL